MRKNIYPHWQITDLPSSLMVFFALAFFTYGILFRAPYSGFDFNTGDGRVLGTFIQQEPSLQAGDILVRIGDVLWVDYKKDARLPFFENVEAGEIVEIVVMRNGTELTIQWKMPGFNEVEFDARVFNIWGLAYIFWIFGATTQVTIRPRNESSRLFIAANYLTALWLIFGSFSATHLWESSILLHVATWLLFPVYLRLFWVFPRPFRELPKTAWFLFYGVCVAFAIAEFAQALPRNLYSLIFLVTLAGCILLAILHFIQQPDQRRNMSLLIFSTVVAFTPSIVFSVLVTKQRMPDLGPAALLALPLMPLAFFYIIQRRTLRGLELRVNRIFSLYTYMILFGIALILYVIYLGTLNLIAETLFFAGSAYTLATTLIATIGFPAFQKFVEKRFFGIKLPYQNLQESYSNRIITSASMPGLLQLLEDEVFPSLLVRQYAFMQVFNGNLKTPLVKNVNAEQLPSGIGIEELTSQMGIYLPDTFPVGWIRLILPLKVGDSFIGFWLLGQRDPDDYYPQAEIPILQSIANQTAIALSNILHAEQLRKIYQSDIERYEQERMHLALELHDSVLNEFAVLRAYLDENNLSPKFRTSYEEVTQRLREIVSDLRPPMLMYGLLPAINGLADNLMERSGDKITIEVNIQSGEERLPQNIEQHLFRIVQEACGNALRHAQAKSVTIFGRLSSQGIDLTVADDGTGFEPQPEFGNLIANHHFGLAGMIERAKLIGAEMEIQSSPNIGTKIYIRWNSNSGMN
jgi:signal transduction histidine kinase